MASVTNIPHLLTSLRHHSRSGILNLLFFVLGTLPCKAQQPICDTTLWSHVYHNYRLIPHNSCTYAIGYVQDIYTEPDGDYHIKLKVEPDFKYMLNSKNYSQEDSNLICEIICANQISQPDAEEPCQNYSSGVYVPNTGEHVKITGSYVTDNSHGWNEIHPVTSIEITTQTDTLSTAILIVNSNNITMQEFPNPASTSVNFQLNQRPLSPVFITITDGIGRLAGQFQMKTNPMFNINTSYFPSGTYYYSAIMNNKLIMSGKFIVTNSK